VGGVEEKLSTQRDQTRHEIQRDWNIVDGSDGGLVTAALPYTKTGKVRLRVTMNVLKKLDLRDVEGDFVECGVWRGGQVILARSVSPKRVCWLYDTFDGMTPPTDVDTRRSGEGAYRSYLKKFKRGSKWAGVSLSEVRANLQERGVLDDSLLKFVVGDVCETLKVEDNLPEKIAVLRLDTDWYESTKAELEVLYPRLVEGGVLIVDDYGHWMGSKKAVNEYFGDNVPRWHWTDYSQVWAVKC
jgi:O-methyltransferase